MQNISNEANDMFEQSGGKCPIVINCENYVAPGGQVTNHYYGERQARIDPREPLASYIYNPDLLHRVILAANSCTTTAEVNDKVIGLLRQSRQIEESVLRKVDFLNALIPHLTAFKEPPTAEALYRAIKRNS